jgi:regulatory protein
VKRDGILIISSYILMSKDPSLPQDDRGTKIFGIYILHGKGLAHFPTTFNFYLLTFDSFMTPCFDYSAAYLSKYPKTTVELRKKLKEKGFSEEDIEQTIPRLEASGFLNDVLWAKLYLQSLWRKGKPKSILAMKLREKGISKDIFEQVWEEVGEEVIESIDIKLIRIVEQYRNKGLDTMQIKQKLYAKGYGKEMITRVLENKESQVEEFDK